MRNRWRARIISLGRAKRLEEHECYTAENDKLIVCLVGPAQRIESCSMAERYLVVGTFCSITIYTNLSIRKEINL